MLQLLQQYDVVVVILLLLLINATMFVDGSNSIEDTTASNNNNHNNDAMIDIDGKCSVYTFLPNWMPNPSTSTSTSIDSNGTVATSTTDSIEQQSQQQSTQHSSYVQQLAVGTILGMDIFNERRSSIISELDYWNTTCTVQLQYTSSSVSSSSYNSITKSHLYHPAMGSGSSSVASPIQLKNDILHTILEEIFTQSSSSSESTTTTSSTGTGTTIKPPCAIIQIGNTNDATDIISSLANAYEFPFIQTGILASSTSKSSTMLETADSNKETDTDLNENHNDFTISMYPEIDTTMNVIISFLRSKGRTNYISYMYDSNNRINTQRVHSLDVLFSNQSLNIDNLSKQSTVSTSSSTHNHKQTNSYNHDSNDNSNTITWDAHEYNNYATPSLSSLSSVSIYDAMSTIKQRGFQTIIVGTISSIEEVIQLANAAYTLQMIGQNYMYVWLSNPFQFLIMDQNNLNHNSSTNTTTTTNETNTESQILPPPVLLSSINLVDAVKALHSESSTTIDNDIIQQLTLLLQGSAWIRPISNYEQGQLNEYGYAKPVVSYGTQYGKQDDDDDENTITNNINNTNNTNETVTSTRIVRIWNKLSYDTDFITKVNSLLPNTIQPISESFFINTIPSYDTLVLIDSIITLGIGACIGQKQRQHTSLSYVTSTENTTTTTTPTTNSSISNGNNTSLLDNRNNSNISEKDTNSSAISSDNEIGMNTSTLAPSQLKSIKPYENGTIDESQRYLISIDNLPIGLPLLGIDHMKAIRNVKFHGVSDGTAIQFTSVNPNSITYRMKETITWGAYNLNIITNSNINSNQQPILQYKLTDIWYSGKGLSSTDRVNNNKRTIDNDSKDINPWTVIQAYVFADNTTIPTTTLRVSPIEVLNNVNNATRIIGIVLTSIIYILSFLGILFTYIFRNDDDIMTLNTAYEPTVLYVLCFGSMLYVSPILSMSYNQCISIPWLLCLGHILIYFTFLIRVWLVNDNITINSGCCISSPRQQEQQLGKRTTVAMSMDIIAVIVFICTVAILLTLIIWNSIDPLKYIRIEIDPWTGATYGTCSSNNNVLYSSLLMSFILVITFTIGFICWTVSTNNHDDEEEQPLELFESNEIRRIGVVSWLHIQIMIVFIPCFLLLQMDDSTISTNTRYITLSLFFWTMSLISLMSIFVPKFVSFCSYNTKSDSNDNGNDNKNNDDDDDDALFVREPRDEESAPKDDDEKLKRRMERLSFASSSQNSTTRRPKPTKEPKSHHTTTTISSTPSHVEEEKEEEKLHVQPEAALSVPSKEN